MVHTQLKFSENPQNKTYTHYNTHTKTNFAELKQFRLLHFPAIETLMKSTAFKYDKHSRRKKNLHQISVIGGVCVCMNHHWDLQTWSKYSLRPQMNEKFIVSRHIFNAIFVSEPWFFFLSRIKRTYLLSKQTFSILSLFIFNHQSRWWWWCCGCWFYSVSFHLRDKFMRNSMETTKL